MTLLEQGQLAAEGSGNDQGILYTRMSREHSPLADFSLQSFHHASSFYRSLFTTGRLTEGVDGALCGTFQQDRRVNAMLAETLANVPELVQVLSAGEAEGPLGIAQPAAGFTRRQFVGSWQARTGWICRKAAVR